MHLVWRTHVVTHVWTELVVDLNRFFYQLGGCGLIGQVFNTKLVFEDAVDAFGYGIVVGAAVLCGADLNAVLLENAHV